MTSASAPRAFPRRWAAIAAVAATLPFAALLAVPGPADAAALPTATFAKPQDWTSGFEGKYTIGNGGDSALNGWRVEFDLPAGTSVGSYWDSLMTKNGNHYTFANREYNGSVGPGAKVSFGFVGTGAGSPQNCRINGQACAGGPTSTTTTTTTTTTGNPGTGNLAAAPYYYYGWGNPQPIAEVMNATGVKAFTLAFILAGGGCSPSWDGQVPVATDTRWVGLVKQVRANGGEVMPSIGGWSGSKLGEVCQDAPSLAAAYQQVIDKYALKAIDLDIENTEFESAAAQDRIVAALKIVRAANPGLKVYITIPTTQTGLNFWGTELVRRAVQVGVAIDAWTLMPFNFGATDLGQATIAAMEALKGQLKDLYPGHSDDAVYRMMGISSMNGRSDQGEFGYQSDFQEMLAYAQRKHLGRFTYWSVNRDRQCASGPNPGQTYNDCGSVPQQPYDFTKIIAQYRG